MIKYFILYFILIKYSTSQAIEVTDLNWQTTLASTSFAILNFYVDWCIYCRNLEPFYAKAASNIHSKYNNVILAKINGEVNPQTLSLFKVRKFPTLIIFKNGKSTGREYMGKRSDDAIQSFVEESLFKGPKVVHQQSEVIYDKDTIVGRFVNRNDSDYQNFYRVCEEFSDDCNFYSMFIENSNSTLKSEVFFSTHVMNSTKRVFNNLISDPSFFQWVSSNCRPLIKEITYSNAEEITNSGVPLLILFVKPNDNSSREQFESLIVRHTEILKDKFRFVYANAYDFQHPLFHLGRNIEDVPVVAIDDYKHMYAYPSFKEIDNETTFKQYIADYESGKLHSQLHHQEINLVEILQKKIFPEIFLPQQVDPQPNTLPPLQNPSRQNKHVNVENSPDASNQRVESVFKKLAPNQNRYTMLRFDDEL